MSETTTPIERACETPDINPADLLLHLIVALLAPMFLGVTSGDIELARLAAARTVSDYRARSHADLIAVAQIIAFGLAAIGSLSLSMADDLSIAMALRLRGNAVACSRSAEQNRAALRNQTGDVSDRHPPVQMQIAESSETDTAPISGPQAEEQPAAEAPEHQPEPIAAEAPAASPAPMILETGDHRAQAMAMLKEALKIDAGIRALPPAERQAASSRVAALNSTASQLLNGRMPLPSGAGTRDSSTPHP